MPKPIFKVDAKAIYGIVKGVARGQRIFAKPFEGERAQTAAKILRFGPGGIKEQFDYSVEMRKAAIYPWKVTEPFGNRPGSSAPMAGGRYERAWLGLDRGSITRGEDKSVEIGVMESEFPQVKVHQGNRPMVKIFANKPAPNRKGDWAMRIYLGLTYNFWFTIHKVRVEGIRLVRRRVSISNEVLAKIRKNLHEEFGKAAFKVKITTGIGE